MSAHCKHPCQHLFPHSFSFLSNVLIFIKLECSINLLRLSLSIFTYNVILVTELKSEQNHCPISAFLLFREVLSKCNLVCDRVTLLIKITDCINAMTALSVRPIPLCLIFPLVWECCMAFLPHSLASMDA